MKSTAFDIAQKYLDKGASKAAQATTESQTLTEPIAQDNHEADVKQILVVWRRVLGIELDPERVSAHLVMLRQWERKKDMS